MVKINFNGDRSFNGFDLQLNGHFDHNFLQCGD